ncbi:MAG TPA: site-2 protease family protein [Candidatus Binatia bacterium]|nr:site-2 protease family protein [Candidatus Binatia bacterium]
MRQPPLGDTGSTGALRFFGIPVRFHFTFVLLFTFLVVAGSGERQSPAMTAVYVVALIASVLLHELGHAATARAFGIRTVEIVMYPIGGLSRLDRRPRPREELWIALAGPAANVALAGAILARLAVRGRLLPPAALLDATDANLPERLAIGNLLLGAFNLLPAYPMDGGRVLRALLALFRPEEEATRLAAAAGRALAVALGLAGLLAGSFLLVFVALFVYLGATQEAAVARGRALTAGATVRAAMITDLRTLSHGQTLRAAGDLLLSSSQQDFPVVHGGRVVGLLTRAALLRATLAEGPDAYVAGVMERDFPRAHPDDDLWQATAAMRGPGACVLVMDGDALVGMLTSENVTEFLLLRQVRATHDALAARASA